MILRIVTSLFCFFIVSLTLSAQVTCDCGEEAVLDAGSGFTTYNWSDGSNNQTLTIDPLCPSDDGNYSVTVTDNCGTTSDTYNVDVCTNGPVTINTAFYTGSAQICLLLANAPTCCKNPQYQWTNPCGEIVSTNNLLSSAFGNNQITVCGIYTLTLVSCNGCTECTSSATINIQNGQPNAPDCCGGSCGCVGCTAQITSWAGSLFCNQQGTYTANTCTGATLDWEVLNGSIVVATGSGTTFNWTPTSNGTYTVRLTVLDDCGITTTDEVTTTVIGCTSCEDCSSIGINANNTPSCNNPTTFTINCPSATNISWSITGGGGTPNGTQFTYTPIANGTYTVTVQFTDECGNIITDTYNFTISDCISCQDCTDSNITTNNTPSCDTPTTFSISCSNTSNFTWTVNGATQGSNTNTMTFTPTSNQNYNVQVSFVDECGTAITKTFNFTITDCTLPCDCNVSAVADDANCEIDMKVTGANCNNYTMTVLKYGSTDGSCTMGNCTLYNNLTATTQTVAGGDCTGNSNDLADYKIVLFPNSGTGCTIKEDCVTLDCCPQYNNPVLAVCDESCPSGTSPNPNLLAPGTYDISGDLTDCPTCGGSFINFDDGSGDFDFSAGTLTSNTSTLNTFPSGSGYTCGFIGPIDKTTGGPTTLTYDDGCNIYTWTFNHDCP